MLQELSVYNYKAFVESTVPIRPITILLGANSVGKSSIIQLLLGLSQTAEEDTHSYKSALKIYGSSVNFGSIENIFHGKKTNLTLGIDITINDNGGMSFLQEIITDLKKEIEYCLNVVPLLGLQRMRDSKINNKAEILDVLTKIKNVFEAEQARPFRERLRYISYCETSVSINDMLNFSQKEWEILYDFAQNLSTIKDENFTFSFGIKYRDKTTLVLSKIELINSGRKIVSINKVNDRWVVISDYTDIPKDSSIEIASCLNETNTLFNCVNQYSNRTNPHTLIGKIIIEILRKFMISLASNFSESKLNYVGPLRAHPKRYYMLDKAKVSMSIDTLDGDAIAEVLKENAHLKLNVNNWLKNFGFTVNVENFKEVIHHLKVNQNGLNLDITDVGFGISQVLPIIIQGFLSKSNTLTIIEQPEIHLHPKMQADLADLFIDIVNKGKNRKLMIETHSEYLLKRLRRRISEGIISANDVSICLFHPQTEGMEAHIENLIIGEKGYFQWPEEFYDGELEQDLLVYLKNQ